MERENELRMLARTLAEFFYRDEFASFAGAADSRLGDGASGRLRLFGRTLYLKRGNDEASNAAVEFCCEMRMVAIRMAALPDGSLGAARSAACRRLEDADMSTAEGQKACLDLLTAFSSQGAKPND